jgi:hypothetical protein
MVSFNQYVEYNMLLRLQMFDVYFFDINLITHLIQNILKYEEKTQIYI